MGIRFGVAKATARGLHWGLTHVARRTGGSLPGKMALRVDPQAIAHARGVLRRGSVVVAGTNGKTTCTNLLADALEQAGFSVCCNRTGANLAFGVASTLLECRGADWGVLESDELWLGRTLPALQPDYLVLLNLFRDQLDRCGEIDRIQDVIVQALTESPRTVLIYNADDPLCAMVARRAAEAPARAGVRSVAFGLTEPLNLEQNAVSDTTMCQACSAMLEYDYRQYGQLGAWHCPACGFERPALDVTASNVRFTPDGLTFEVTAAPETPADVSRETFSDRICATDPAAGAAQGAIPNRSCTTDSAELAPKDVSRETIPNRTCAKAPETNVSRETVSLDSAAANGMVDAGSSSDSATEGGGSGFRTAASSFVVRADPAESTTSSTGSTASSIKPAEDVSRETVLGKPANETADAAEVRFPVQSHLVGSYMVYNLLAVATAGLCAGASPASIQRAIDAFDPQNGRLQRFRVGEHDVLLNLAKNPTGFNQNLRIVVQQATAASAERTQGAENEPTAPAAASAASTASAASVTSATSTASTVAAAAAAFTAPTTSATSAEPGTSDASAPSVIAVAPAAAANVAPSAAAAASTDDNACAIAFFINDNNVDGNDISWIWDIDFEELRRLPNARVFAGGVRRNDLQVRLRYAGIEARLIESMADVFAAGAARDIPAYADASFPTDANVYAIANYTALAPVRAELTRLEDPAALAEAIASTVAPEPTIPLPQPPMRTTTATSASADAPANADMNTGASANAAAHTGDGAERGAVVIAHLFPDLLNLYGDGGNVRILEQRLRWRGIPVEVRRVEHGQTIDLREVDLVFLGGGPDREQALAAEQLMGMREQLAAYAEAGGPILAICGAYQILGKTWLAAEGEVPGLGILDIETRRAGDATDRLISDIALDSPLADHPVVGYENHASRTFLGPGVKPFGRVISRTGHGNNDTDRADGAVAGDILGTYLHGTLLAKNPEVADWLLERALARHALRTGGPTPVIEPLNDTVELAANAAMMERLR